MGTILFPGRLAALFLAVSMNFLTFTTVLNVSFCPSYLFFNCARGQVGLYEIESELCPWSGWSI